MTRHIIIGFFLLSCTLMKSQSVWTHVGSQYKRSGLPDTFQIFHLDRSHLNILLSENDGTIIDVPEPSGKLFRFRLSDSKTMHPDLAAAFPSILSYNAESIDVPGLYAKIDLNESGFFAMVFWNQGVYYVQPLDHSNGNVHTCFYRKHVQKSRVFEEPEILLESGTFTKEHLSVSQNNHCIGDTIYNYRVAIGCTHQYAIAATAQPSPSLSQVLSKIVLTLNRVNGILEKEVSTRLVLVPTTTAVIFISSTNDAYTADNNISQLFIQSQMVIDSLVGDGNYDLGHTFCSSSGGLAWVGGLCTKGLKARGVSGSMLPLGDPFDVDYVCHEIGHQLGATHTFNSITGSCNGNRNHSTAVEPGSGVTIMGYAGLCSINNISNHSIPYLHAVSHDQIISFTRSGKGSACALKEFTGNKPPVIAPLKKIHVIPAGTPFALSCNASDPNGDPLTYSWEEISRAETVGNWNADVKPYFRSYTPTLSPVRYFPSQQVIMSGNYTGTKGEYLTSKPQFLYFRFTARDNRLGGGGVCSDSTTVILANIGPFRVTEPNGYESWWPGNSTQTVHWLVNGTDGSPIYCGYVNIYLSLDEGRTFTLIAEAAANNGSATISVPSVSATTMTCRIKVSCAENIFYDVSDQNFVITADSMVAIEEWFKNSTILKLWPNPVNDDVIFLQLPENHSYNVKLFDLTGRLLQVTETKGGTSSLDLHPHSAGMYFVEATWENGRAVQRLLRH